MKSKKMSLILGIAIPLGIIASSSSIIGCNILDKPKSKNSEELKWNQIIKWKSSTFTSIKNTKRKR
ncbi:hypothetical protein [Mycoplasmopsis cynos]|uniref:hypothetical protein n=1 Tax=Mycoplasmopsis cynos TaxID=171284 RepID=UPI0021F9E3BE|nr:hypothetical protein [Mycoplasmopsis cynos]UWV81374.1 hypothetical protein NW065_05520 [Mycoplasmopsis cynos]